MISACAQKLTSKCHCHRSLNVKTKCKKVSRSHLVEMLTKIINTELSELERQDKVKDLGVWSDERLTLKEHMNEKIYKAYMIAGFD